jgi:hypothetical protein
MRRCDLQAEKWCNFLLDCFHVTGADFTAVYAFLTSICFLLLSTWSGPWREYGFFTAVYIFYPRCGATHVL